MLTCKTCGEVLPEGTSFCPNCGMPVEHTDSAAQPDAPNAPAPVSYTHLTLPTTPYV